MDRARPAPLPHGRGCANVTGTMTAHDASQTPAEEKVRVLFIAGAGRSGSTLLDRLAGSTPGACSLGEVNDIWASGFRDRGFCGCGERFGDCAFWAAVAKESYGSVEALDARRAIRLKQRVRRARNWPALRFPALAGKGLRRDLRDYGDLLAPLYRAAAKVSGARLLVDSSKYAFHGAVLHAVPGLDVRTVHLVRDSRAVAFSWARRRTNPRPGDESQLMPRRGAAASARLWTEDMLAAAWLSHPPKLTLRYEDLARDPAASVARVLAFAGVAPAPGPGPGAEAALGVQHVVSGNPMRFDHGQVAVKLDDEWRRAMPRRDRLLVTALTWPLLWRYGYL